MTFRDEIERETSRTTATDFVRAVVMGIVLLWRGRRAVPPPPASLEVEARQAEAAAKVRRSIERARQTPRGGPHDDAA